MIKFDLEKALAGGRVITRDGREVTQLTKFNVMTDRSLCGVVDRELCTWLIDGARYVAGEEVRNYHLFMAPKKLSGFVNAYSTHQSIVFHHNREQADLNSTSNRIACIDLSQFEEGHGLDD